MAHNTTYSYTTADYADVTALCTKMASDFAEFCGGVVDTDDATKVWKDSTKQVGIYFCPYSETQIGAAIFNSYKTGNPSSRYNFSATILYMDCVISKGGTTVLVGIRTPDIMINYNVGFGTTTSGGQITFERNVNTHYFYVIDSVSESSITFQIATNVGAGYPIAIVKVATTAGIASELYCVKLMPSDIRGNVLYIQGRYYRVFGGSTSGVYAIPVD